MKSVKDIDFISRQLIFARPEYCFGCEGRARGGKGASEGKGERVRRGDEGEGMLTESDGEKGNKVMVGKEIRIKGYGVGGGEGERKE